MITRNPGSAGALGTTSVTLTKPPGTVSGDVLVVFTTIDTNNIVAPAGNWIKLQELRTTGIGVINALLLVAGNNEPASYVFTGGSTVTTGLIDGYRGVDIRTPLDILVPAGTTGTTATISLPTVTPLSDNACHIGYVNELANLTGATDPASYTAASKNLANGIDSFFRLITPPPTTVTATMTDPQATPHWQALSVVLRPAPTNRAENMGRYLSVGDGMSRAEVAS